MKNEKIFKATDHEKVSIYFYSSADAIMQYRRKIANMQSRYNI
jgi:hypothetical protein